MPSISTLSSLGFSSPFDPKLLPLIPTALSHSFHSSYCRSELGFTDGAHYASFSLSNPTTRKAFKKSWRWMGRIFPASTCIKSSTSRIYKSLASLALLLQDPSRPPYTDFWYQNRSNAHCDPESLSHRPCPDSLSDPSARSWTAQNAFLYPAMEST